MNQPHVMLTVEQAAEAIGIGRTTMFALVKSGDIESVLIGVCAVFTRRPSTTTWSDSPRSRASRSRRSEMAADENAKKTRAANGESSIYFGSDGYCHGRVTMGIKDDGTPDRRHVKRKVTPGKEDRAWKEVEKAVRKLEKERDSGTAPKAGPKWTVEKWLRHWVENIAAPTVRYKTITTYRTVVYKHLIPGIGAHKLERIEPDHFEKLYGKLVKSGLKPVSVHQVHRTARTAFNEALRRGRIGRNPVALAKPPLVDDEDELVAYSTAEIQRLITAALKRRNETRYVLALAMGTRQGETLGLKWERLDEESRTLAIRRGLQFQKWQHGCDDPHKCGERLHKKEPCKPGCKVKRHKKQCPPPCAPDCAKHASSCPQRHGGGLVEVDVKSKAGRRTLVLPEPLFDLITAHKAAQNREHGRRYRMARGRMDVLPGQRQTNRCVG